jgi:Ni/Co efflux regulator RcnB
MKRISVLLLALVVAISLTAVPTFAQSKESGKAKTAQKDSKKGGKKADEKKADKKKADAKKKDAKKK